MKKNIIHIGYQYFAEPAPGAEVPGGVDPQATAPIDASIVQPTPIAENTTPAAAQSFTQADVERLAAEQAKQLVEAYKAQQGEAEKLSKMKQDERMQYQLEQAERKAEQALSELNAYKLKDEAVKIAAAEGLPLPFLRFMDFHTLSAEQVNSCIREMAAELKQWQTAERDQHLKQQPPPTVLAQEASSSAALYAQNFSKGMEG